MGNSPSHTPIELDGYMAVRASIEARFSQPPTKSELAQRPGGCCDAIRERSEAKASTDKQQKRSPRDPGESSNLTCLEPPGGGPLPPTLSVAETTDTNSDGAPDEFEAAPAAEELLGGLSQSFTRVKAPQVRAPSPLPFPSMAACSPTVSTRSSARQRELQHTTRSSSNEEDYKVPRAAPGASSPQPSNNPQRLTAELLSWARDPAPEQKNRKRWSEGVTNGTSSGYVNESDMFCPLSPNSALGATTPTAVSAWGAPISKSKKPLATGGSPRASPAEGNAERRMVPYGPVCNHSPFLEGKALQALLPFLFGPSLGACLGVCVHWFMRISDGLKDMCSPLTRDFETAYEKYFFPLHATLKLQPLQTADGNGARLDWVITAKVLAPAANSVLSLGYCFEYRSQPFRFRGTPALGDYKERESSDNISSRRAGGAPSSRRSILRGREAEGAPPPAIIGPPDRASGSSAGHPRREVPVFSVAVAPAGSKRRVWLHRDLCRFHGDETGQAVLTPLGPVCVGDIVEVPVVLSNGIGLGDLSTVRWLPLHRTPRVPRVLTGQRALEAVALGIYEACALELQYVEWFDGDQYRHMTTERVKRAECMEPELQHLNTAYSGIDVLVRRSLYSASRAGLIGNAAQRAWGLQCQVLPADAPIVFPLTRKGLLHDRASCLQLREGDILEAYLTIGGANF